MAGVIEDLGNPIVIDNGSAMMRAGFAGDTAPRVVFPTIVGKDRPLSTPRDGTDVKTFLIGEDALANRDVLRLRYPMEFGFLDSWDDMELIWRHILHDQLRTTFDNHPILLAEQILSFKPHREKTALTFFEEFNALAMYLATQSVLSLYASGRLTGAVYDSGLSLSYTVPVYEGYALGYTLRRPNDMGGQDLSNYLLRLLKERGYGIGTPAARRMVEEMKEKFCYVATDFEEEELASTKDPTTIEKHSTLPDGQVFTICHERFRCPEALFKQCGSQRKKTTNMVHQSSIENVSEFSPFLIQAK